MKAHIGVDRQSGLAHINERTKRKGEIDEVARVKNRNKSGGCGALARSGIAGCTRMQRGPSERSLKERAANSPPLVKVIKNPQSADILCGHVAADDGYVRSCHGSCGWSVRDAGSVGCWRLLPSEWPKWQTVYAYFVKWSKPDQHGISVLEQALKKSGWRGPIETGAQRVQRILDRGCAEREEHGHGGVQGQ